MAGPTSFPRELLRPDAPTAPSFTMAEVPHRAKLDQNESPRGAPPELEEAVQRELAGQGWNRYPQPQVYQEIKERFGEAVGLEPERFALTVGCDQVILAAFWAAGGPGRTARVFEPTYPIYGAWARTTQTELDQVVLGADFDVTGHGLGDRVDLLCLVSPNNPTGDGPDRGLIQTAVRDHGLVLVDEAYVEYDPAGTVIDLVDDNPSLVIGRSLSKALLAGVRLGYAVGHPELINVIERLLFAPYHLNALQLAVARHCHLVKPHLAALVEEITAERGRIEARLDELGLERWPSRANFVLFEVDDAKRVNAGLLDRGIRLRDVSTLPGLSEHLRVTVGTAEENDLFLEALAASL